MKSWEGMIDDCSRLDLSAQTVGFVRKLARNLLDKSDFKIPPVVLKKVFLVLKEGIIVKAADLGSEDGFSIGLTQIVYNSNTTIYRQRFTVAHELGHILLGHNSGVRVISYDSKDPNEKLANEFAAELLVPRFMLKKEDFLHSSLLLLSSKYEVSSEMMIWRLKNTGMYIKLGSWN